MNSLADSLKKRIEDKVEDARFTEITSNVLLSKAEMSDILENGQQAIEKITERYRAEGKEDVKIQVQRMPDYDEVTSHWAGPRL